MRICAEFHPMRLMTQRLAAWIGPTAIRRPFAQVAQEVGVSERTVRDIFHAHVADLEGRDPTLVGAGRYSSHPTSRRARQRP